MRIFTEQTLKQYIESHPKSKVANVKGNTYRIVAVIKFTIKFVYIRFVGTHAEYDKINCKTI